MADTPWGPYPWDTSGGGHWPWETPPAPAQPAAPPDTSARDALIQQYAARHGGWSPGTQTTVYDKPTSAQVAAAKSDEDKQKLKQSLDSGFDLYTFGDGTTVELSQDGQQRNYKPVSAAAQKANQPQPVTANTADPKLVTRDAQGNITTVDNPNYKPPTPAPVAANTTDAKIVLRDPADPTKLVTVDNPNYVPPKPSAVSANTTDQNIVTQDAQGNLITKPNPNYVAPKPTAVAGNTTDQFILTRDADGNITQKPNPNYVAPTAAPITSNTTDQFITLRDPKTGNITTVPNPNYQKAAPAVVGAPGTTEQNILIRDPTTGAITSQPNPNYVAPRPTQITPSTTAPFITTQDAKGNLTSVPNPSYTPTDPGRMAAQLQQQATQQFQTLQQQVAQGSLTQDQATSQFNQYWDQNIEPLKGDIATAQAKAQGALAQQQAQTQYYQAQAANLPATLAQTASEAAQRNVISMLPYVAGKGFDAAYGKALTGGWQHMNPSDVVGAATYSLPNLQEVGRQGAAAALANISPTAQAHLNAPGPTGQPPVGGIPDLSSLLNRGAFDFGGAPPAAAPAAPAAATAAAPGVSGATTPGFNLAGMPGAGLGGQSTLLPPGAPASWMQSAPNFGAYGLDLSNLIGTYAPGQYIPV